jgi:glyoxylase-like metal-dependent hydrolase (beta-lactamase superfamily II)
LITLTLLAAGHCTHFEAMVMAGSRWQSVPFPALFALLEHPRWGPILFDTGYTARFFAETRRQPASLYAKITPVSLRPDEEAVSQLAYRGIPATTIRYVIISHFHADHIAGLKDFPNAQFIYLAEAYQAVHSKRGWSALRAGFLPGLLPADFEQRSRPASLAELAPLPPDYAPFTSGVDLFGDGTILAVPLPGHATGQMGLFLQTNQAETIFLAADACWHSRAYRELLWPHPLANLALAEPQAYRQTLTKLHHLHHNNPRLKIIPSHCREVYQEYIRNRHQR